MLKKIFKKKQKGFTLTELLGVVVILLTIVLVAVPTIGSTMEKNKNRILEQKKKLIISAAEVYASKYKEEYDNETFLMGNCGINLMNLIEKNLITKEELTDANGNLIYDYENKKYIVKYDKNNINYIIVEGENYCVLNSSNDDVQDDNINNDSSADVVCFEAEGSVLTKYSCDDVNVIIPSKINGVTIKKIGNKVFEGSKINSVTIPDSITTIGVSAFEHSGLSKIIGGLGIETIEDFAFYYNMLTTMTFYNNLETIGKFAFAENELIGTITIPSSVTSIEASAFGQNRIEIFNLLPSKLTINNGAFESNQNLRKIIINDLSYRDWGNIIFNNSSGTFGEGCAISGVYEGINETECNNKNGVYITRD